MRTIVLWQGYVQVCLRNVVISDTCKCMETEGRERPFTLYHRWIGSLIKKGEACEGGEIYRISMLKNKKTFAGKKMLRLFLKLVHLSLETCYIFFERCYAFSRRKLTGWSCKVANIFQSFHEPFQYRKIVAGVLLKFIFIFYICCTEIIGRCKTREIYSWKSNVFRIVLEESLFG